MGNDRTDISFKIIEPKSDLFYSEDVKHQIDKIYKWREKKDVLKSVGIDPIQTALFYGKPGTGKTSAVSYLSFLSGQKAVRVDIEEVFNSGIGQTPKNILLLFEDIRKSDASIFLIDEFDSVAGKRHTDSTTSSEERRIVNSIIKGLDLLSDDRLIIFATNEREYLDQALLRRLDMSVEFPLPKGEQIYEFLHYKLTHVYENLNKELPDEIKVVMDDVAHMLVGYSIAEIEKGFKLMLADSVLYKKKLYFDEIIKYVENNFIKGVKDES